MEKSPNLLTTTEGAVLGLTRTREIEQRGRPDKAVYRITRTGRGVLRRWLDEVEDEPTSGRVVFPLKLFFCDFASPGTAQAHLAAYRRYLTRRLERYEQLRDGGRRFESDLPGHVRSEEHTSELQSHHDLVCRLLLEKKT